MKPLFILRYFKNRMRSFHYAFNGIAEMLKTQHNARLHLVAAGLAVFFGYFLRISATEWLFVVFSIGLVLFAEAVNTALEYFVDFVSPEKHEKAGKIKDLAAGAVLIAAITAACTGGIIFIPKLLLF